MGTGTRMGQLEEEIQEKARKVEPWTRRCTEGKKGSYLCGREVISIGANSFDSRFKLSKIWGMGEFVVHFKTWPVER
jgi:hypothetical protein